LYRANKPISKQFLQISKDLDKKGKTMDNNITQTKKYNRLIPVIASIAIQLCMGIGYIWSVFQSYLIITDTTPDALFNWPATHGTLAYSLLLGLLAVGALMGGYIQNRHSPREVMIVAGVLMGGGFFLAQYTTESTPWVLWLSYGVLPGLGMGMAYTNTISCCQRWFPDKRGLITGIVVSALGIGGLIFTPFAEHMINAYGVLPTFKILGIVFFIICVIISFLIKNPPEGYQPEGWTPPPPKYGLIVQDFSPREVLRTPQFYLTFILYMCATSAGSMMIPMAKILGLQANSGLTKEAAIAGVMIIAICNALGRICWGAVSDKIGSKKTIRLLLIMTIVSIALVAFSHSYLMLVLFGVIAFSYGGFLGVFPALTADFWGVKYVATNYGLVMLGFGIGVVISSFTVAFLSKNQAYLTAFIIAAAAAAVGLVILAIQKAPKHKDEYKAIAK